MDPVTILGFLQQTLSDTFYHPDIVGTTVAAFARKLGFNCQFEDYLLDRQYREDNFEVQAQDILFEFQVKM